jgi:hypothetical protein
MDSLTEIDILGLAMFCAHERIAPENVRLQMGRKFFDGREFSESDKTRILERLIGLR